MSKNRVAVLKVVSKQLNTVTVIALHTREVLSTHTIDPTRSYWRNEQKEPGRWPGSF